MALVRQNRNWKNYKFERIQWQMRWFFIIIFFNLFPLICLNQKLLFTYRRLVAGKYPTYVGPLWRGKNIFFYVLLKCIYLFLPFMIIYIVTKLCVLGKKYFTLLLCFFFSNFIDLYYYYIVSTLVGVFCFSLFIFKFINEIPPLWNFLFYKLFIILKWLYFMVLHWYTRLNEI